MAIARERWATKIGLVLALAGNCDRARQLPALPAPGRAERRRRLPDPLLHLPARDRHPARVGRAARSGAAAAATAAATPRACSSCSGSIPSRSTSARWDSSSRSWSATYYVFVESWCLAYSFFSLTGSYFGLGSLDEVGHFLAGFQGVEQNQYFASLLAGLRLLPDRLRAERRDPARRRRARHRATRAVGDAAALRVRGDPDGARADARSAAGRRARPERALRARFHLEPGLRGARSIRRSGSPRPGRSSSRSRSAGGSCTPMRRTSAPTTTSRSPVSPPSSLNEVAEVVLGGTIALTASVVFFGVVQAQAIAGQGSFDLGFHAMPLVLEQIPGGRIFGAMWFLLLFFAGITSSVAMMQPTIALLREDFGLPRNSARCWSTAGPALPLQRSRCSSSSATASWTSSTSGPAPSALLRLRLPRDRDLRAGCSG